MTLPLFGGITVTVQRSTTDRFNDKTYADHHAIDGCLEYPTGSDETGEAVTDRRTLLVPTGSDIEPSDRVKLHGVAFQVDGLPMDWVDPFTGWSPGMAVQLMRVS